jgi:hypothetical protein
VKKIKKKSLALRSNSLALHYVFGGQTTSSLRPYGRNAQIICIGNNNSTNSFKTLENGGVGHFKTFNTYHN